jgi:hypothetical protein
VFPLVHPKQPPLQTDGSSTLRVARRPPWGRRGGGSRVVALAHTTTGDRPPAPRGKGGTGVQRAGNRRGRDHVRPRGTRGPLGDRQTLWRPTDAQRPRTKGGSRRGGGGVHGGGGGGGNGGGGGRRGGNGGRETGTEERRDPLTTPPRNLQKQLPSDQWRRWWSAQRQRRRRRRWGRRRGWGRMSGWRR